MPKRPELPPEPWWEDDDCNVRDGRGNLIASVERQSRSLVPMVIAAPAALRVCEMIIEADRKMTQDQDAVRAARAALAIAYPEPEQEKPLEKRLAKTLSTIRSMCIYGTYPEIDAILAECRQRGWLEE